MSRTIGHTNHYAGIKWSANWWHRKMRQRVRTAVYYEEWESEWLHRKPRNEAKWFYW